MAARGEAEPSGFSREKISFAVVIDADGAPVSVDDLRDATGKRPVPTARDVPASFKRPGTGVKPFFLWDTTAYTLGVDSTGDPRTPLKRTAFRDLHEQLLVGSDDVGLLALLRFLKIWTPERFANAPFTPDMLDANIVFRFADDEGGLRFVHERPAALPFIETRSGEGETAFCLVTGVEGPMERLHPSIKGVNSSSPPPGGGHSLVSFNLDAFESWGKKQGANAPTSQAAAACYGAALNRLLDRGGGSRMRVGDATVVFWADTRGVGEDKARAAEQMMAGLFGATAPATEAAPRDPALANTSEDAGQAVKVREALATIAEGRPTELDGVAVEPGTEVHILGLSPNAARLSVRFWLTERLVDLARNLARHEEHCRIEPLPWKTPPSINWLLVNSVAARRDRDNIPPLLAGEVARAVLSGTSYPWTLLSSALTRLRAGEPKDKNGKAADIGWQAAVIRAVLMRLNEGGGAPVGLDKEETNRAYRLGRLFAVLEEAQEQALGRVNATIRDRYFGAASATPASVFPLLLRGVQNHLGKLRKDNAGAAAGIEIKLGEVIGGIESDLPRSLRLEEQGRFAIGYYHQRSDRFRKRETVAKDETGDTNA